MKHIKIKCKDERYYHIVNCLLDMSVIEHYQKAPGKAIHLCGFHKKKDIEELLENYGVKKNVKIEVEKPDFNKIVEPPNDNHTEEENEDILEL